MQSLSEEFDERCQQRYDMGAKKYGHGSWVGVDTIEMALEELLDLDNYVRFTFIKLRLLQEQFGTDKSTEKPLPGNEMLGKETFMPAVWRQR